MSEKLQQKYENKNRDKRMTSRVFASHTLETVIAPPSVASHVGDRIRHAARKLGWAYGRTKDLWYNDGRYRPSPEEIQDLERISGLQYGKQELNELDDLISKADALLYGTDADFTSAFTHALREVARAAYRAGTQKRN